MPEMRDNDLWVASVCFTEEKDKGEGGQRLFHCLLETRRWDFEPEALHKDERKEKPRKYY